MASRQVGGYAGAGQRSPLLRFFGAVCAGGRKGGACVCIWLVGVLALLIGRFLLPPTSGVKKILQAVREGGTPAATGSTKKKGKATGGGKHGRKRVGGKGEEGAEEL